MQMRKMKVQVVNRYTNSLLKKNRNKVYVFGDNVLRQGKAGQAIIRDQPNSVGIRTKLLPNYSQNYYMDDQNYQQNCIMIDQDISNVLLRFRFRIIDLDKFSMYEAVVFPKDCLGSGLAKLRQKAPFTWHYLFKQLMVNFGFNNHTGQVDLKLNNYYYMSDQEFNNFLKDLKIINPWYGEVDNPNKYMDDRIHYNVGNGWLGLVKQLIQDLIKLGWDKKLYQCKQKFAQLRFYIDGGNKQIFKRIFKAKNNSQWICQSCGNPGCRIEYKGLLKTLCKKCSKYFKGEKKMISMVGICTECKSNSPIVEIQGRYFCRFCGHQRDLDLTEDGD